MTRRLRGHAGFSLVELLVAMTLVGIMLAFSLPAIRRYTASASLLGGTEQVASAIRLARFKSIAEHHNVILRFQWADHTYTMHSDVDGDGLVDAGETVRGPFALASKVEWANSSTTPVVGDSLVFYPNGTLLSGGAVVLTANTTGTKTVTILASTGGVWVQ